MGEGSNSGGESQGGGDGSDGGGGQGNEGGSGGQGGQGDGGRQGSRQQQQEVTTAEKVVIAASVGFTLLLFAYAGWQMATPAPADVPQASVVGTDAYENGSVAVTVELRNPTDVGLVTATVELSCDSPPPEVQFSFVPASSTRTGTLVCPAGTMDPSVTVSSWVSR